MRSRACMARAAALLLLLCAVSPAASRSRFHISSIPTYGRSLLQEQSSCCDLVDATAASGGSVTCGPSGLVLTVSPVDFTPLSASISVVGKSGYTATSNPAALVGQTCSSRYGPATWASAGSGTTTLAATASDTTTCATGTDGTCQGLVSRFTPKGKLAVQARHTCSIQASDSSVACSGDNTWGQLGTGNNVNYTSLRPVLEPGTGSGFLTGASWLAVGGYFTNGAPSGHSCACMNDGRAFCWGQNYGQLAAAVPLTTTSVNRPVAVVTDAAGATPMTNCRAIAANLNHTVFLTADGSVHTAGRNGFLQLGLGVSNNAITRNFAGRVDLSPVSSRPAVGVSAGKRHTCVLFDDGKVACVGANGSGQLGRGFTGSTPAQPTFAWALVPGITDAVQVHCGELSVCVLRKGGKVSCWGQGIATGNPGIAASASQLTPYTTIPTGAIDLAMGDRHGCAVLEDNTVKCWGTGSYGLYGQLGDGGPSSRPGGPWTFPQKSNFVGVVAISAGPGITCIANGIGQRLCAGNGQYGQLAKAPNATSQNNTVPVLTVVPGSASDAAGPFATPASFVTISDSTKPVCSLLLTLKVAATCSTTAPVFNPPLQNINAEATSEAGVIVTFNVSANKEGVPVPSTCTPASGFLFPIGDTTVTCTAGSTTGTFVVSVADNPPVFSPPLENFVVDATSAAGATVTFNPTANKGGAPVPVTCTPVSGFLFPIGDSTVSCTAGGVTTETFVVSVVDAVFNPPLANISVNATSGAGATVTFDVTADKGGVPVPVTCTPASGFLFPIGDTTVTCTASFTTGTFVVSVADVLPIVFNPPLANISVNATSTDGATVTFDVTADKGGVPVPVTCTPASGFLFPIGDTTVTCTAGSTTGTFVVTVVDVIPIVFNPPLQNISAEATSTDGATVTFNVTADKGGVPVPVTCTPASGFLFPIGDTTVTCTAGSTTGTFVVSVDGTPAVFNPPLAGVTVDATSADGATVTFDVTADKGGVPVPVTCTPASGFLFPIGDTTVTCTASFTTGTFVVSVAVAPPAFIANAPTEPFEANTADPYLGAVLTAAQYTPRATDPIDGDLSSQIETVLANGTAIIVSGPGAYDFPLGSTVITNSVANSFGVTSEETVTIRVIDTTPPVVTVAAPAVIAVAPGSGAINYAGKCTATDLAPVNNITYSPASGGTAGTAPFLPGSNTTVTCTATDSSNNVATGTFTVAVSAAQAPVFGPGPSGPFEATTATPYLGASVAGLYAPTATDPVQGDISSAILTYLTATNQLISLSGPGAYIFPLGRTNITNVVTNAYGVTAQQTVTIRVIDTTPPVVTVAAPAVIAVAPSSGAINYAGKCTATDLAPVNITYSPASGGTAGTAPFLPGSNTTVTCIATDSSNNVATGTFRVSVAPAPAGPTFGPGPSGPFEATVNKPYLGTSVAGKYAPTASDPVDGNLSSSIKTYLVSNNQLIALSGSRAYIFEVGSTQIRNTVTNSRGATAEQIVTIVVVAPPPLLEVKDKVYTVPQDTKVVRYENGACKAKSDLENGPILIEYSPRSGLPVGTAPFLVPSNTTVTCTATTPAGGVATGTFQVVIRRPPGQDSK